jgi:lactose/L-arabinose transport system permease protein
MMPKKKGLSLAKRHNLTGWLFLTPAVILICWTSFYPMIRAFILSLQTGLGVNLKFGGLVNYLRILKDPTFKGTLFNTFFYLIIQVPIMLLLALVLASMLNNKDLRFKGLFRTCIFLPCATSLVSYAMIFRSLFANDGFVNTILRTFGLTPVMWFSNAWTARAVIIIALVWRWTGYNMVFYLSGLQNIEYSIYEAARIDGASPMQIFFKITIPLLKPTILLTTITSTNGTLQLFDESLNLTNGGPGKSTMTMSHYIYNTSFVQSPNFGYAAAMSIVILVMVAILALLQMKVGDER